MRNVYIYIYVVGAQWASFVGDRMIKHVDDNCVVVPNHQRVRRSWLNPLLDHQVDNSTGHS
jgi:hypothetical protein